MPCLIARHGTQGLVFSQSVEQEHRAQVQGNKTHHKRQAKAATIAQESNAQELSQLVLFEELRIRKQSGEIRNPDLPGGFRQKDQWCWLFLNRSDAGMNQFQSLAFCLLEELSRSPFLISWKLLGLDTWPGFGPTAPDSSCTCSC